MLVQGITIAPPRQGRRAEDDREPAIVVEEDATPGFCVVTVEHPVAATGSSSGRAEEMRVIPPSEMPTTPTGQSDRDESGRARNMSGSGACNSCRSSGGAAAEKDNSRVVGIRGGRHGGGADAAGEPRCSTDTTQR